MGQCVANPAYLLQPVPLTPHPHPALNRRINAGLSTATNPLFVSLMTGCDLYGVCGIFNNGRFEPITRMSTSFP